MREARKIFYRWLFVGVGLVFLLLPSFAQEATGGQPWDLKYSNQDGLFVFYDSPAGASTTGKPVDVGDFDGDGCGDLAITGQNATHAINGEWRGSAGHVRIVMNTCPIDGVLPIDAVPEDQAVFTIYGAYAGDMAGTETYVADFNGDGYDDLLFSAQNSDGVNNLRSNSGAAYVLFGSADFAQHEDIDLRTPPDDILIFYGATAEDRLGLWVEGGDFDGNGYHDLLIGANQADGVDDARINAGEVWIIYGRGDMKTAYPQVTDLAQPPQDATRIIGVDYDDLMGSCLWGDDLNGDGYDDVIVSAGLWRASSGVGGVSFGGADGPANRRYNSGETFVIFGGVTLRGQTIDLAQKIDEEGRPLDDSVTVIYGADANDLLGEEIAVGDMDGDGRNDLVLGTLVGDGAENNLDEAGEAWILYTHEPFAGQMFDLAEPDPERAIVIYPDQPDSKAGDTLRVDDIDGDGYADLFYGAPDYDARGEDGRVRVNTGLMAVIFGQEGLLPSDNGRILLFEPPQGLRIRFIIGADDNDMMPYAMAIYDMDGDGVIDIIPNAMGGDGANNDQINAGEIFIINGAEFLADNRSYQPEDATVTPSAENTQETTAATPLPDATVSASSNRDLAQGQEFYEETCAGCHGFQAEGVTGLGLPLTNSPLVLYASDEDLLAFIREGRAADHPDNVVGVSMPPSGGRPDWTDEELLNIIAYLRQLRDENP